VRSKIEETGVAGSSAPVALPGGAPVSLSEASFFRAVFDEVDYGMLILDSDGAVLYANHAAHAELDARDPLRMVDGALRSRRDQDAASLRGALHSAFRDGSRSSITIGEGARRISAAVVPIASSIEDRDSLALISLARREIVSELSVDGFARAHALTRTEARVLLALSQGLLPADVAASFDVTLSTVRYHIGSIRHKTGAESFIGLIRQVAVLPPMVFSTLPASSNRNLPVREAPVNRRELQPLSPVSGAP
jgi:DNA-binding CsgD family transcriptional regulator